MKRIVFALALLWPGAGFAAELVQRLPEEFCLAARAAASPDQQMLEWTHCLAQEQLTPHQRAMAYNARAVLYAKKEDYQNAIADLNSAIAADPTLMEAYLNRGAVYRRLNDFDKALSDLNQAIKLDPSIGDAYLERGSAYASLSRFDEAIADFTTAIGVDPKTALSALTLRAFAHAGKKDWAGTIEDCTAALKINDAIGLYVVRAAAYLNSEQYQQALADFSTVVTRDPGNALAYNNRATAYAAMKRHDLAIADLNKAIALSPSRNLFYENRGYEYDELGDCKSALADFDKALSLTIDGVAYSGQSWVRATCPDDAYRNGAQAVDLAIKAMQTGAGSYPLTAGSFEMTLAAAFAENGQFDEAAMEQGIAIKLMGKDVNTESAARAQLALQAFQAKKPFRWPASQQVSGLEGALPATGFASSDHAPARAAARGTGPIFMTGVALPGPPPLPLVLAVPKELAP